MKKIKLTQNKWALVNDSDFIDLNQHRWYAVKYGFNWYAERSQSRVNGKRKKNIKMHRMITNAIQGVDVDHIDGDGLNNQRQNLRLCTRAQNLMNRGLNRANKSGYKGVIWCKGKWMAYIVKDRKQVYLGRFTEKLQAYKVYCKAAKELHGEFAHT